MGVDPAGRVMLAITRGNLDTAGTDDQLVWTRVELVGDKRSSWRFLPSLERPGLVTDKRMLL